MKCSLQNHPERNSIGLALKRNRVLADLDDDGHAVLRELVTVHDGHRGESLLEQGSFELMQFFVLDGWLKRVVTSAQGREMALRFAGEGDIETCYEAWRLQTAAPFSVVCTTSRTRVVALPMSSWCALLEDHPCVRQAYQERVFTLGASLVEHAVALLLLDAPSRMRRFLHEHSELLELLPQKDLASHLNLCAETMCRLSRRSKEGELVHLS